MPPSFSVLFAESGSVTVGDGFVSVTADNAAVTIFSTSGMKVAEAEVSGSRTFNLGRGIYIVKVGNTIKKVAVK